MPPASCTLVVLNYKDADLLKTKFVFLKVLFRFARQVTALFSTGPTFETPLSNVSVAHWFVHVPLSGRALYCTSIWTVI